MAQVNSVATITQYPFPSGADNTQRCRIIRGKITLSPGFYPPGGFPLNWGLLDSAQAIPPGATTPSSTGSIFPTDVNIKSVGNLNSTQGTGPSGYIYLWDNVNGNMHIFLVVTDASSGSSGPLIEMGGAIPPAVFLDTIQFEAIFPRE
jgi:hypothetical protein